MRVQDLWGRYERFEVWSCQPNNDLHSSYAVSVWAELNSTHTVKFKGWYINHFINFSKAIFMTLPFMHFYTLSTWGMSEDICMNVRRNTMRISSGDNIATDFGISKTGDFYWLPFLVLFLTWHILSKYDKLRLNHNVGYFLTIFQN